MLRQPRDRGENAKQLRREMGVTEQIVWGVLRGGRTGFKFRRQVPVGKLVLDFYCHEARLAVEIDGEHHADQREYDAWRDHHMSELGVETLRIPSLQVTEKELDPVGRWVSEIVDACVRRTGRDPRL